MYADGLALVLGHTGLPAPLAGTHEVHLLVESAGRRELQRLRVRRGGVDQHVVRPVGGAGRRGCGCR